MLLDFNGKKANGSKIVGSGEGRGVRLSPSKGSRGHPALVDSNCIIFMATLAQLGNIVCNQPEKAKELFQEVIQSFTFQ